MNNFNYLILAGTEKSGTTSVYHYLNAHPHIAGSAHKETDYFRSTEPHSLERYEALFPGAQPWQIRMEASPGYLAESSIAAPAMSTLLPQAKLLFILRDPIERLLSGFDFHKSRFHIPENMTFDTYIDLCMRYEQGKITEQDAGLKTWHLRVPEAGRYALHLRDFYERFPTQQIKLKTLDDLQRSPAGFMYDLCTWAGLDSKFYEDYEFLRSNVTFSPRRAWLQRVGLVVNKVLEPFFNQNPRVKQHLLSIYKKMNGKNVGKPAISPQTAALLAEYYAADVAELQEVAGGSMMDAEMWLRKYVK